MAERDWTLSLGRPHPTPDRLQADAVLIGGKHLERCVGVLGPFLGSDLREPFLKVSCSSGVAAAGWRGRGVWIDQPIARSASQPRCGRSVLRPSSPAIQAATFGPLHSPPSGGGSRRRSRTRARSSGLSTLGGAPFWRRRSPRASGPRAL